MNYWLVDLGSANGSYVNDVALTSARMLSHGDRIQFGNSVLVFQQGELAQPHEPPLSAKTMISLGGTPAPKSVDVTLFVADLKGFTQMSAQLSADQVADLLREWYADCHAILAQYGASIDKFIGDCVFAYWHGTDADIRSRALRAARGIAGGGSRTDVADANIAEGASTTSSSTAASASISGPSPWARWAKASARRSATPSTSPSASKR